MQYTLTSRSIVAPLKLLLAAITVWPLLSKIPSGVFMLHSFQRSNHLEH
jgi:hypothetical protein